MKETRFKDTEIGKIPEEWMVKRLGDIFDIGNGRDYKHLNTGNVPVYGTGGLMTFVNDYLYDGETVCIGRKGTINIPQYHKGKIWTVDTLFYTYNFRDVNVRYLYYLAQIIDWNAYNTATGVPSLTSQNIGNILASLPPIKEQRRIASALTSIDNLISSLGKLIEKKKNVKQGTMQQLLTGKTRLKGFGEPWVEQKLGEVASICTGKRNGDENVPSGKYPFFVRSQEVYKIDTYSYDGEAIMVPGEGGIGSIFHYINGKFDYHQRVYKISDFANNIVGKFVYYYMQRFFGKYALENSVKATVDSLRLPTFENFEMNIPRTVQEQHAIASILTKMDDEITALEAKKAKCEAVKQGMMQQLLTGKIRLIS